MKHLIIKMDDGSTKSYGPIMCWRESENGEKILIEKTEEQIEQELLRCLISDIRREEFEKAIKFLVADYLSWPADRNMEKIQIIATGSGCHSETNICLNRPYDFPLPKG